MTSKRIGGVALFFAGCCLVSVAMNLSGLDDLPLWRRIIAWIVGLGFAGGGLVMILREPDSD